MMAPPSGKNKFGYSIRSQKYRSVARQMNTHQLKLDAWIETRAAEAVPNFLGVVARDQRANLNVLESNEI
jgi:hypothetical protein